jgi:hydroxymethylbilane synthase
MNGAIGKSTAVARNVTHVVLVVRDTVARQSPTMLNTDNVNGKSTGRPRSRQPVVVGSRGSALALWQTQWVIDRLRAAHPDVDCCVEQIRTQGDRTQALNISLTQLGGKAVFVVELERALLAGAVDIAVQPMNDRVLAEAEATRAVDAAVHSLKDLPGKLPEELTIAAVTAREDPRDALVSRDGRALAELPSGARVATSSLRRRSQLLHLRPDLHIEEIRGNVDTRVRKVLDPNGPDAVVLAVAGLLRLGLERYIAEYLSTDVIVPAAGQGALAVEVRRADQRLRRLLAAVDHRPTRQAVLAERALLVALGGGCQLPLGAHATLSADGATLELVAVVGSIDGTRLVRARGTGPATQPARLGRRVAAELRRGGASAIIGEMLQARS